MKIIDNLKVWNKRRHEKNRDRLWNKLTKDEQLELMLLVVNKQI